MSKLFTTQITTPQGLVFDSDSCYLVTLPGEAGDMGIMANHQSILTNLRQGEIKILDQDNQEIQKFTLNSSGFAEMIENKLIIVADKIR